MKIATIHDCIQAKLASLCKRVETFDQLTTRVATHLSSELAKHCRVGSISSEALILVAKNNLVATELRFSLPKLRKALEEDPNFPKFKILKILVDELAPKPAATGQSTLFSLLQSYKTATQPRELSDKAAAIAQMTAASCSHPPLKKALENLASRGKKKS